MRTSRWTAKSLRGLLIIFFSLDHIKCTWRMLVNKLLRSSIDRVARVWKLSECVYGKRVLHVQIFLISYSNQNLNCNKSATCLLLSYITPLWPRRSDRALVVFTAPNTQTMLIYLTESYIYMFVRTASVLRFLLKRPENTIAGGKCN